MQYPRKKSFAAELLEKRKKKRPSAILVIAVIVAVAAVGYALYIRFWTKEEPTETVAPPEEIIEKKPSIAVLPFVNMSDDETQEYFCDGLAETILNHLTHVKGLSVKARTSSFAFKGKEVSIREIGKQLNVETVLEGSVLKSGNRLLITAQLINVADETHIFSNQYEREMEDMFNILGEISLAVVDSLKITLFKTEKAAIEKRSTENIEAYQLYLKGRYFWNKRNEEGFNRALNYFQQACDKDPNYSRAYVGIADTYILKGTYGFLSPKDAFPIARAAAEKALLLDNTIAEAHTSLAYIYLLYDWVWTTAESEFKQALELNPNYADTHHWYSVYLSAMERVDEAIIEIKRARELDPLSVHINAVLGAIFYNARKYDEAIEQLHKTIEMDPNHPITYCILGMAYYAKAMWKEAIEADKKYVTLSGGSPVAVSYLGSAYAASGQKDEALKILDKLNKLSKEKYVSPYYRAIIYIALGETDQAFEYLEKCYVEREPNLVIFKVSSFFDPIRSDPRFKALMNKMGLPE